MRRVACFSVCTSKSINMRPSCLAVTGEVQTSRDLLHAPVPPWAHLKTRFPGYHCTLAPEILASQQTSNFSSSIMMLCEFNIPLEKTADFMKQKDIIPCK